MAPSAVENGGKSYYKKYNFSQFVKKKIVATDYQINSLLSLNKSRNLIPGS